MADQDSIQAAEELDMEVALATGPDGLAEQQQQSSWWSWLGWTAQKPKFVKIPDVPYPSMTGVAHPKHKVDIYIPSSKPATTGDAAQKWPVLVHCHGGGWVRGDKSHWFYGAPATATAFAANNFLVVTIGYRTKEPFPAAIEDVADAIAWVHQHIGEDQYGGDANRVFVSGHSAGGHLASLVTLDRRWLNRRQVPSDFIKGVVSISGIYNVSDPMGSQLYLWGYNQMYIRPTFSGDVDLMNDSSPLTHLMATAPEASNHIPPFLVLNASSDFTLEHDGKRFSDTLLAKGLKCTYQVLQKESHGSISRSQQTMTIAKDFLVNVLANLSLRASSSNAAVL